MDHAGEESKEDAVGKDEKERHQRSIIDLNAEIDTK